MKSLDFISWLCPLITILIFFNKNVDSKSIETMEYTLNLIKEGDDFIQLGHDNIILLLGNTGSGKSTLAHFLTGDNNRLLSKEIGVDTGEFIIEDLDDKISNNSTLVSKTIFPELVLEPVTKTAYYDCPGFSDTRNSSIDIASTYFIHKVIDVAKTVKNIFVVNYSSVKEGVDRTDFLKLLKHAGTFFKNIDVFKTGIGMIVTKVDNLYMKKGSELILVSDDKILGNIAQFLDRAKVSINDLIKEEKDKIKLEVYANAVKMVDILLTKDNGVYSRIGLFRRPDEPGPLTNVKLLQDGKASILNLIQNQVTYSSKESKDFGYTISDESKNDISDLIEVIGGHINTDVAKVGQDVTTSYFVQEEQFSDIYTLKDYFRSIYDEVSAMIKVINTLTKPRQLVETLQLTLKKLNLPVNQESINRISSFDTFIQFIETIGNKEFNMKPLEWTKAFQGSLTYLEDSRNIYTFLIDFYVKLADWSVQKNPAQFNINGLKATVTELQNNKAQITGTSIKGFLDEIYYEEIKQGYSIRGFDSIKNSIFDERKFKVVYEMIDLALFSPIEVTCQNDNKVIVKGDYVKLSYVLSQQVCPQKVLTTEIYALNKIFIDQDLVDVSQNHQVILMAPLWEIIDGKQINLIGESGIPYPDAKAARGPDGTSGAVQGAPGVQGVHGRPGLRGHPGGSFFGINDRIINGQNLAVVSTGGNGASGQIGGDGGNGENGRDVDWTFVRSEKKGNWIKKKKIQYYAQNGGAGGVGGNGGNGGKGGLPGVPSEITLMGLSEEPKTQLLPTPGQIGPDAGGGIHGIGGQSGNQCTGKTERTSNVGINGGKHWKGVDCHKVKSNDGVDGAPSANFEGLEPQEPPVTIPGKKLFVDTFKTLLNSNVNNHYKKNSLTQFINIINNNPTVNQLT